jgi:hypothetical protein
MGVEFLPFSWSPVCDLAPPDPGNGKTCLRTRTVTTNMTQSGLSGSSPRTLEVSSPKIPPRKVTGCEVKKAVMLNNVESLDDMLTSAGPRAAQLAGRCP